MKYKLNVKALLPGDIILVGYNDEDAREIQRRTNSKFSHAMLYWYGSIIHAADIVITENPSRILFDEDEDVCVLRLKEEYWDRIRIGLLIYYARSFVGTFYDKRALNAMRDGKKVEPKENRQMCSRFVAQCFDYVCLDIVDDYETCSPEDIYKSTLLSPIEDKSILVATQWDIDFANSYDVTSEQYKAIKSFIISLKRQFPQEDIVSLNQLENYIEKNPTNGDIILELLKKTEYFNLCKLEKEHCQYLYNVEAFKSMWKEASRDQAFSVIRDSKRIIDERSGVILAYKKKQIMVGDIAYYRQMLSLQEKIIETAKERIEVAEEVLLSLGIVKVKYPWVQ